MKRINITQYTKGWYECRITNRRNFLKKIVPDKIQDEKWEMDFCDGFFFIFKTKYISLDIQAITQFDAVRWIIIYIMLLQWVKIYIDTP